jgi:hypothetical protein
MYLARAIKFCNLCYEYSSVLSYRKLELSAMDESRTVAMAHVLGLRDNATVQAMKCLEEAFDKIKGDDILEALRACQSCGYGQPKISNLLTVRKSDGIVKIGPGEPK